MSYIMESVAAAAASPLAAYPPSEDLPDLMGMVKFAAQVLPSGERVAANVPRGIGGRRIPQQNKACFLIIGYMIFNFLTKINSLRSSAG